MPNTTIMVRGRLLGAGRALDVVLRGGRPLRIVPAGRRAPDFGSREALLCPALFDAQVNGAAGFDLQSAGVSVDDVAAVARVLARNGVSHWIPTVVTGALETMEHACAVLAEAAGRRGLASAIAGIHIEGPWISAEDGPRGAHPKQHVRAPVMREFRRLQRAAGGRLRYATVAPEIPGMIRFIRTLVKEGLRVSLGHHDASSAQICAAADAGACMSTHLGNGAASMMHRHNNPLWPQLAEDRLHASIIADLHHLPVEVLQSIVRAKGAERIVIVSDCTHLAGMPAGRYTFAGQAIELRPDKKVCLAGTDYLAGSATLLLRNVANTCRADVLTLSQAIASASTIPARLLGVRLPAFPPKIGRPATFMVLDPGFEDDPEAVFIKGRLVHPDAAGEVCHG